MKKSTFALATGALLIAAAFTATTATAATDEVANPRDVANTMMAKMKDRLVSEIQTAGAVNAIDVCAEAAPKLAAKIAAENGMDYVRRVTFLPRNPKSEPVDVKGMDHFLLSSLPARDPKLTGVGKDERILVNNSAAHYARGLYIAPLCLQCHGSSDEISPEVRAKLNEKYPNDKATGYKIGDLRGAIIIKQSVQSVKVSE